MKIHTSKKELPNIYKKKIVVRKDESQKYKDLKHELNTIIRNINIKFNFQNFSKEKLQPLEIVSKTIPI